MDEEKRSPSRFGNQRPFLFSKKEKGRVSRPGRRLDSKGMGRREKDHHRIILRAPKDNIKKKQGENRSGPRTLPQKKRHDIVLRHREFCAESQELENMTGRPARKEKTLRGISVRKKFAEGD